MLWNKANKKAEEKIKQTLHSKTTTLSLDNEGLSKLPESLVQLTNLERLYLSDNELTILPESLGQLTNLKELYLNDNELTRLPKSLGQLTNLERLDLRSNELKTLPKSLGQLTNLKELYLNNNRLVTLPESLSQLTNLSMLFLSQNNLTTLPESLGQLTNLSILFLSENQLTTLPESLGQLKYLKELFLSENQLTTLPQSLGQSSYLIKLLIEHNQLEPELAEAYKEGLDAVKAYLRTRTAPQMPLYEAKLLLIGEGNVGKSCLLSALRDEPWVEGLPCTHGIKIKQLKLLDSDNRIEITLNSWDFGGQSVYRPTHQLFFSAPAVYLVVWKPREGTQQGFVKEWIDLIKLREPDAKILVVATHGGPQQSQPDINRQELWDLYGKDTVIDFFHVDSKPDNNNQRQGINELKQAITRLALALSEMGRLVPQHWQEARDELRRVKTAYLPLNKVFELCSRHRMDNNEANLFITISHRLGHFIHYRHDLTLRDVVVLKPNWLATAVSIVLNDKETRESLGLVRFSCLKRLWNDPNRSKELRYPKDLHPIFLSLMERFDLSYRVDDFYFKNDSDFKNLIARLVPDIRPEDALLTQWPSAVKTGDTQQTQICCVVDDKGQSATAAGLFYLLIVRLHKYSLGRDNFSDSIHWQRGLILDDDYNGRALLEHIGNDVHVTVRAPYPERFLAIVTGEVKFLIEKWKGLRCNIMVPCMHRLTCIGRMNVKHLIAGKKDGKKDFPCPICGKWKNIDELLRNAASSQPLTVKTLFDDEQFDGLKKVLQPLSRMSEQWSEQSKEISRRFDSLDAQNRGLISCLDDVYTKIMKVFTSEAKEGPCLFSFVPADRSNFNPRNWIRAKFRLTLWCEHSRLPLPLLNDEDTEKGVYEIELDRDWFKKVGPGLKVMTGILGLILPVAASAAKFALDEGAYKEIANELDLGKNLIKSTIGIGTKIGDIMSDAETNTLEHGEAIQAEGAALRELQVKLKAKDPGFGGLIRVMNKQEEFLWVHPQFEKEY